MQRRPALLLSFLLQRTPAVVIVVVAPPARASSTIIIIIILLHPYKTPPLLVALRFPLTFTFNQSLNHSIDRRRRFPRTYEELRRTRRGETNSVEAGPNHSPESRATRHTDTKRNPHRPRKRTPPRKIAHSSNSRCAVEHSPSPSVFPASEPRRSRRHTTRAPSRPRHSDTPTLRIRLDSSDASAGRRKPKKDPRPSLRPSIQPPPATYVPQKEKKACLPEQQPGKEHSCKLSVCPVVRFLSCRELERPRRSTASISFFE
mmetsp:Transcript_26390/g.85347  ORF Transcript_26390/g.85347 Transcript_26390/m.85347 type:complete len:260 (-) Transcript_26390:19-798(-)